MGILHTPLLLVAEPLGQDQNQLNPSVGDIGRRELGFELCAQKDHVCGCR